VLKNPAIYMEVEIADQIDRPFLAQFRPSLTDISHVAWRGAPLVMTGGTKGGAQRHKGLGATGLYTSNRDSHSTIYHLLV
jgi:hypothetical protein